MNHLPDAAEPSLATARGDSQKAATVGRQPGTGGRDFYDPSSIHHPPASPADWVSGLPATAVKDTAPDGSSTGSDLADGGPPDPPVDRAERAALISDFARPDRWIGFEASVAPAVAYSDLSSSGVADAPASPAAELDGVGVVGPAAAEADTVSVQTSASAGAGLVINLEFDANALAAPASFRAGIEAAAAILEAAITDPITVNVAVGYGEYDGTQLPDEPNGDISLGGIAYEIPVSYSLLKTALATDATSATDTEAADSLPNTVSLNGLTNFFIAGAQAKAMGVLPATNSAVDGYVGFPTSFTGNVLTSAGIVELMHALGLANDGGLLTLVEYTSAGNHLLTEGTSGTPAYFSLNGGSTDLANYDVGFDSTLFTGLNGDPLSAPDTGATVLTSLDLTEIGVLGFDDSGAISLPTPSITPTPTSAGSPTVTVQNVSVAESTAIVALSLIKSVTEPSGDSIVGYVFEDTGTGGGYFAVNGITEPDDQRIDVLDTQLTAFQYVGGSTTGSQVLDVSVAYMETSSSGFVFTGPPVSLTATTTLPTSPPPPLPPPPPSLPPPPPGMGSSELFWQNAASGEVLYWSMQGTSAVASTVLQSSAPGWRLVGTTNFGDGTADLLWQNTTSGEVLYWTMLGNSAVASTVLQSSAPGWSLVGATNFGDGTSDLLWQNTASGEVIYWTMEGNSAVASTVLQSSAPGWRLVGATSFGDGTADLLWQNTTSGEVIYWTMLGNSAVSSTVLQASAPGWSLVGATNFGDGTSDLLWQNTASGEVIYWTMQGNSAVSSTVLQSSASGWQLVAALASSGAILADATTASAIATATEITGNATLELSAASAATIDFAPGAAGILKLDQSAGFTGTVAGFAAGDTIDLADIAFGAATTLGYTANTGGSGGTLSVSDGTHAANLALLGQYAASGFATAPDPGGGTLVTYLTQVGSAAPPSLTTPQH